MMLQLPTTNDTGEVVYQRQIVAAQQESMDQCRALAQIYFNDYRELVAAEKKMKPEDVVPRTELETLACLPMDIDLNLQHTEL